MYYGKGETEVGVVNREIFLALLKENEIIKDWLFEEAIKTLLTHTNRLLSLLQHQPFVLAVVTFLAVFPVRNVKVQRGVA